MERAVFKRETIQLKYLPKVEKKNAEDRCKLSILSITINLASQGKLSRQIANLKQTLKHTTENTMQLDTTIEQRKREITNISQDINNERDQNEQFRNDLKRSQLELLARRLEFSQVSFQNVKLNALAQKFAEVATGRFTSSIPEDQARQFLDQEVQRNAVIDAVVNRLRNEDPMLDQILKPLVEW